MRATFLARMIISPDSTFFDTDTLTGMVLNFGCGNRKRVNEIGVDTSSKSDADHVIAPPAPIPLESETFDWAISRFALEHVSDLDYVMREVSRLLKPGGRFRFCVPHAFSMDAYDDPTHVRFFTLRTMKYYVNESDVHYASSMFSASRVWLRVSLAFPRMKVIRYPANFVLGGCSLIAPVLWEQLLKFPFLSGALYFELTKGEYRANEGSVRNSVCEPPR